MCIFPVIISCNKKKLNIGNNKPVKLLNYIKQIELKLKKKAIKRYLPLQKGDIKKTLSDSSLLSKIIKFKPKTSIKHGINKFIDWYLDYYNVNEK